MEKIAVGMVVALILFMLPAFMRGKADPEAKPTIYVLNCKKATDFYDNEQYLLQYAIDGKTEMVAFWGEEDIDKYLTYLGTVGNIIHGGEK